MIAFIEIGETNTDRLVDKKQRRVPGPAPWVIVGAISVLVDEARTDLFEETDHARPARATRHPQGQWILGGVVLAFKVPKEKVIRPKVKPTRVLC